MATIGAVVAVVLSAGLAGGVAGPTPAPGVAPPAVSTALVQPVAKATSVAPTVVMIIRHAEKPHGSEHGVDAQGREDDHSLTRTGWKRAEALATYFDGPTRPGVTRPRAIYAAGANEEGEGLRTRETVAPLASHLGIPVNTDFGKGDEEALVERVLSRPGPTLIAWQHKSIPDIAAAFPDVTPKPPSRWTDSRFDTVWIFTKTAEGWHFNQATEMSVR